jgi:hypothetical protein
VVNFEQTLPGSVPQIYRIAASGGVMPNLRNDKHKEYARYAAHCLDVVTVAKDQETRSIQREMAAEWLKLADAILHPLKPMK